MINFSELAKERLSCPDVLGLKASPTLRLLTVPVQGGFLLCDGKTKVLRPLVPSFQRFTIFSALHGMSHPGVCASKRLISTRLVWRGLANDVCDWCKSINIKHKTTTAFHPQSNGMVERFHRQLKNSICGFLQLV